MDAAAPHGSARVRGWTAGKPAAVPQPGTVGALMSHPLISVDAATTLSAAIAQMREDGIHHLLVTDRGFIVALVSDRNLIRALGLGPSSREAEQRYHRLPVLQVAEYRLVTIEEDTTVEVAAETMLDGGFSALPVVNEAGEMSGIVTSRDLLRYLAAVRPPRSDEELPRAS